MERQLAVPLAGWTTLGMGGPATVMVTARTEEEIVQAVRGEAGPLLILGGGSNLVVADKGFEGTVVRAASTGFALREDGEHVIVSAAAGEEWDDLVALAVSEGLAGMECLSGIPGRVGATPIQNVGAYGQDVSQTVVSIRVLDRRRDVVETVVDAGFGYRTSRFKTEPSRFVVLSVDYRLLPGGHSRPLRYPELAAAVQRQIGESAGLDEVRDAVLALRRRKGMVVDAADPDSRSAGSFFTNPLLEPDQLRALQARAVPLPPVYEEQDGRSKVSAAWLIEHAGFRRGSFEGAVGISTKHTLALVNRGGATTEELLAVARTIRDGVRSAFGIELVPEPVLVGVTL